jgi:hypothetical protein
MCVVALQAKTDMGWVGDVMRDSGSMVGTAPDGTIEHAGPCSLITLPWDHEKPGGPPR